jgi:alkylation response protein AidB-like acyl-CoA dehydrogenase
VRDGDDWVVNGQKVWTTLARVADHGVPLTRIHPEHAGLTMFQSQVVWLGGTLPTKGQQPQPQM